MECKHSSGVTQRLARIAGQVNGIRDMVEEGRPCDDLLVQLSSASSALTQVARLIMAEHLSTVCWRALKRATGKPLWKI